MKLSHVIGGLAVGVAIIVAGAVALAVTHSRPRGSVAAPPAVNAASAQLQSELEGMLSDTLGPDRAVVAAVVVVKADRSTSESVTYAPRGTSLASRSGNATGHRSSSTRFGVSRKVTTSTVVPGSVRSINVAVLVSSTVPAATVKSLRGVVFTAAGMQKSRGDRLSITQVPFPKAPKTTLASRLQACLQGASGC